MTKQSIAAGKIILALAGVKGHGATLGEIVAATGLPSGTASSRLYNLCQHRSVHILPGPQPRKYVLASEGGEPVTQKENGKLTSTIRLVVDIGETRKSISMQEAKDLYRELKELFK
jgi:hypothetical protein